MKVFGIIPEVINGPYPASTYTVDGAAPVVFHATNLQLSMQSMPQVFFHSQDLTNGSHSLVITTLNEQGHFALDSIVFDSEIETSVIGHMPSATSVSEHTPSGTSVSSATSVPSSTPSASAGSTTGPVTPVAAIVVSIFAALLILTVGAFLLYRRYRRNKVSLYKNNPDSTLVSPYVYESSEVGVSLKRHTNSDARTPWPRDLDHDSLVPHDFIPAPNVYTQPSSNSIAWGSIPHSVSTTSTVVGDRSEISFIRKNDSHFKPIAAGSNRRSVVMVSGSRTPGTTESGPPPSWTVLSPAPPSYSTK